jgi:Heterokaryon incompatibility protein (HET)
MSSTNITEKEGYDSFYTPANHAFYRASPYSPLHRSRREIRLLKVSLQADVKSNLHSHIPTIDHYLECRIQNTTSLARAAGEYCTLSYVAGDPTETAPIPVNGMTFNAFANLKHAIVHAFYHWKAAYPDKDLLLWADQICIDQSNKEERGHQVGLMRDIYRRSKRTFVCLSNPRVRDCLSWAPRPGSSEMLLSTALVKESPAVLLLKKALIIFLIGEKEGAALLQDLNSPGLQVSASALSTSDPARGTKAVAQRTQIHSPVAANSMNTQLSQLIRLSRNQADSSTINVTRTAKVPERKEYMPRDSTLFQNSIRAFLINVYWRRAWIYQEFISAVDIHFVSGNICIPWPELLPLVTFLQTGLDPLLESIRQFSQRGKDHSVANLEVEARLRKETRERKAKEHRQQHERAVEAKKQAQKRRQQEAARLAEKKADKEKKQRIKSSMYRKNMFLEWKNIQQEQTEAWKSAWEEQEKRREQFHSQQLSDIRQEMEVADNDHSLLKVLKAFQKVALLSIDQQIEHLNQNQGGGMHSNSCSLHRKSVSSEIPQTASNPLSLSPIDYVKFPTSKGRFQERLRRRILASERVKRLLELDNVASDPKIFQNNLYRAFVDPHRAFFHPHRAFVDPHRAFAHPHHDYAHHFYNNRQITEFDREGYDRNGYNIEGEDRDGCNRDGYNRKGYDRDGYNRDGYDREGYDRKGCDRKGYDRNGYNRKGYGRDGYNRDGYDREGYDRKGCDRKGYDRNGYNGLGYDRNGYNRNGYDPDGYNRDGYDRDGYDRNGYNRNGCDRDGYDRNGYDRNGCDRDGYDLNGYNRDGYDQNGYNGLGYDRNGYDRNGYNRDGYNGLGCDRNGYDRNDYDRNGYNRLGYDRNGYDRNGYSRDGYNRKGCDRKGYDRNGYNGLGYDRNGYNRDGYNRGGYNRNGCDQNGYDNEYLPNLRPLVVMSIVNHFWDTRTANIELLQAQLRNLDASALWSTIQGKRTIGRSTDLISLLQHSRNCDSSDLRDRVYAFLGLAHAEYTITPKYDATSTIATVLIETAEAIIRADESLAILVHVQHGRNKLGCELPTWVPDWTSRRENSDMQNFFSLTHNAQNRAFNAAKDTKAVTEFRHHTSDPSHVDMRIRGVFVDFLDQQDEAADDSSEALVYSTGDAQAVIAPPKALTDDEVWVIYGVSKPVLLRPEGPDTYSFLGYVFVCDREKMEESEIMFGKAVEGEHKAKDIWII